MVRASFQDAAGVERELRSAEAARADLVRLEVLGSSHEGRPIRAVRLGRPLASGAAKPALVAIFAEHGDEHDVTRLALAILAALASRDEADAHVRELLDARDLWLVPLVNPDGADYDLSGAVEPMSWRKNRRPTSGGHVGVDLNRNWPRVWEAPVPESLAARLSDPGADVYAGEAPFSESETRALRDFLRALPELRLFVTYHSGSAPFLRGGVGFPIPPAGFADDCDRALVEGLAEGYAAAVGAGADAGRPFVVARERDVGPLIRAHAPWYLKPFVPKSIPAAPGSSGDWVFARLGVPALGVELMRGLDFFDALPEHVQELVDAHTRAVLHLLEALPDRRAACGRP